MKVGSALLKQLERCGWAAKLADEHREITDSTFRETRTEIARAYHARAQATLPEAHAALRWLMSEPGTVRAVGEPLDLVDPETGEVLVSGRPGAIIDTPEGVLVVSWASAEWRSEDEPEDDLGLLAMGLAAAHGKTFRVASVAVTEEEAFARRSRPFPLEEHAELWARILTAVSRPRVPCPGEWCGACKQAPYCEAWTARAKTALTVLSDEMALTHQVDGEAVEVPELDLTDQSAGAVMGRIKMVRKACEMADEQVKSFVRKGGRCVVAGKEYCPGQRDGKESVSVSALKDVLKKDDSESAEVAAIKAEIGALIKKGDPFEQFGWRKAAAR